MQKSTTIINSCLSQSKLTNGVAVIVKGPEDSSMPELQRVIGERIRRPMYPIFFPPGYPGAAVGDLES